jgi:predicted porin
MHRKFLSLAIAAAMAVPVAASADATLYGAIRQAVESYSMDQGERTAYGVTIAVPDITDTKPGLSGSDEDYARISNYESLIGVSGDEDLGNGLKAIYQIEFFVDISTSDDEFSGPDPVLSGSNSFVGLSGGFGTLLVGRHDTPLMITTGALDYFDNTAADNNMEYTEALIDNNADGTIAYIAPEMSGLTLALAIIPGENKHADGLTDAYSVGLIYSNGGIHASAGYEAADGGLDALGEDDGVIGESKQYRFGLGYDAGNFMIGGVYESVNVDNEISGLDDVYDWDTWVIGAGFHLGNNTLKAKYFDLDGSVLGENVGHDGFAVALDHNLSKRTLVYAVYVTSDGEYVDIVTDSDTLTELGVSNADLALDTYDAGVSVWGVGLNHSF